MKESKFNILESSIIDSENEKNSNSINMFSSVENKLKYESKFDSKPKLDKNAFSVNKKEMSVDMCENENKNFFESSNKSNNKNKNLYEVQNLMKIEEEKNYEKKVDENNQNNSKIENDLKNNDNSKLENESEKNIVNSNKKNIYNEFSNDNTIKNNEYNEYSDKSKNKFNINEEEDFKRDKASINKNSDLYNNEIINNSNLNYSLQKNVYSDIKSHKQKFQESNEQKNKMKSEVKKITTFDNDFEYYQKYINSLKKKIKKMIKEGKEEKEIYALIKDKNKKNIQTCINTKKTFNYKLIKEKICINCENDTIKKIELPCGCKVCDDKCLAGYFIDFYSLERINNYCCICSIDYSPFNLYQLGLIFQMNQYQNLLEDLIKLLNRNIDNKCAFCKTEFGNKKKIRIKFNNDENNILDDYKKLIHFLCEDCFNKIKYKNFNCEFCKKVHMNINEKY